MKRRSKSNHWQKSIEEWKLSGKSALSWCKERKITYSTFLYWRNRLSAEKDVPQASFVEIKESSSDTGIILDIQGFSLHLSKDFDSNTFLRLITILRNFKC